MSNDVEHKLVVEVWADLICPWCGLGHHRFEKALERFEHTDEVRVFHRSFELDPQAPQGETRSVAEYLGAKGLTPDQVASATAMVEGIATSEGLDPYIVGRNRTGSTAWAHELLAFAADQGRGEEAWSAAFRWYFGRERSLFDIDALVELASEIGLDPQASREALESRRYADRRLEDERAAHRLGISGVPFFLIGRRYAVSGAQRIELLVDALQRAWDELRSESVSA